MTSDKVRTVAMDLLELLSRCNNEIIKKVCSSRIAPNNIDTKKKTKKKIKKIKNKKKKKKKKKKIIMIIYGKVQIAMSETEENPKDKKRW